MGADPRIAIDRAERHWREARRLAADVAMLPVLDQPKRLLKRLRLRHKMRPLERTLHVLPDPKIELVGKAPLRPEGTGNKTVRRRRKFNDGKKTRPKRSKPWTMQVPRERIAAGKARVDWLRAVKLYIQMAKNRGCRVRYE